MSNANENGEFIAGGTKPRSALTRQIVGVLCLFVLLLVGSFILYGVYRLLQIKLVLIGLCVVYGFSILFVILFYGWEMSQEYRQNEQAWRKRLAETELLMALTD
jgi:cation transporter-like permease